MCCFFFFKRKTAFEMRISDWSSDVGSSDLKTLGDPAVDALVEAALVDNPTLRQAIARMDQARATARVSDAQRLPQISVNVSVARARTGGVQRSEERRVGEEGGRTCRSR